MGKAVVAGWAGVVALVAPVAVWAEALPAPGGYLAERAPGCVTVAEAGLELTPPELALAVLACGAAGRWDAAAEVMVLMQLRAAYDQRRVADDTSWGAAGGLSASLGAAIGPGMPELKQALAALGGNGSDWHRGFCAAQVAVGAPEHDATWMAMTGGYGVYAGDRGIVPGFDAEATWRQLLTDYMHCEG